jgi:hypothetical protein
MGISFGGGSSQGSQKVELTPEQKQLLQAQTGFLTGTALPAYQQTIGKAEAALGSSTPAAMQAAENAMGTAQRAGTLQELGGSASYLGGLSGLANLFSPQYKQQQISAALQPAQEAVREEMGAQNAMYGGAGGLGSSRQALASRNLSSLATARLGNVAAQTSAAIEGQRQQASNTLLQAGQAGLQGAQQSAASQIGFAQTPQDLISKYAAVIYGTPQGSTTANFQGTQNTSGTSSGKGYGASASVPGYR